MSSKEKKENEVINQHVTVIAPDGGWGWLVALGSFMTTLLIPTMVHSFSLFFAKIFRDNDTPTTTIAWIFSLYHAYWNLTIIFVPTLCARFGWRKVAFTSGLLVGISSILSSFAERAELLFFTFSLLYGIGTGLGVNVCFFIIPRYFEKRRGRVIGVVSCGFCSGQFVVPLLLRSLQESYSHKGALLITGAILLNVCVAATLFHPVEWHSKTVTVELNVGTNEECIPMTHGGEANTSDFPDSISTHSNRSERTVSNLHESAIKSSMNDSMGSLHPERGLALRRVRKSVSKHSLPSKNRFRRCYSFCNELGRIANLTLKNIGLLRKMRVVILAFASSVSMILYFNFLMLLPFAVVNKGHTMEVAAYCLTTIGIFNVIIRLIVSSLTDAFRFDPKWYFMAGSLFCSASIFSFASLSEEKFLLVIVAFYGIGIGSCNCTFPLLIIRVMGIDLLPHTIGTFGFASLVVSPVIGPLIGYIRDVTMDYDFCLKLISLMHLIPFLLWTLMPLAINYDFKKGKRPKEEPI